MQDSHYGLGCTRHERRLARKEMGNVAVRQAINVFFRRNGVDNPGSVNVLGQGHHEQNTNDLIIII